MKYKDLINFQPIESVIKLVDSEKKTTAIQLVRDYVISDEMSERLTSLVFPQVQFESPSDNKGIFIVGNYGTGKSHLMSVVSSIAEDETLLEELSNRNISESAKSIAGKFIVIRSEIGASEMSLRDIITGELEEKLKNYGINYSFPPATTIPNHISSFEEMMALFHQKYPDKGLLLVVDELLDYLRTRKEQALILDLNFLREVGEITKSLRFRFIAGLQEAIFDNDRFSFVANSLLRVKDRFEQVHIARNDVKYVVSNRLLKKNADQMQKIRDYLSPFTAYYSDMNERMDDFVSLFPVHPDYINTFEHVTIVEKREVLKTLSLSMRDILEDSLPDDRPGLIAYDSYWKILTDNSSIRTIPEVREVIDCSEILKTRIEQAFTKPLYKPVALRIIAGLSVHRLTTGDIYAKVGATPEELRDSLCLYDSNIAQLGGDDPADDLLSHVETVLREIHKTVNGQFISSNPDNRQFYLDLKKTEDYDAIIEKKADTLDDNILDRYYASALSQLMECSTQTYRTGFNIWEYELEWHEKRASRMGYLFFGVPNERSTTVPERDFYLYFIQPYDPPKFRDEKKSDEVFFRLKNSDDEFLSALKKYAGAGELARTSSGSAKSTYHSKAEENLRKVIGWLSKNLYSAYEITYQGETKPLVEWKSNRSLRDFSAGGSEKIVNFRDLINTVAGTCLEPHFSDIAPDYPVFSVMVRNESRKQAAKDALRLIANQSQTKQAIAVSDALELLDGERLTPEKSRYVKFILNLMNEKGAGQVLNRNEILTDDLGLLYMDPDGARLEPEWVVVLLAAIVYSGNGVLAIPGQKFDSTSVEKLASVPVEDLVNFKHIEPPKEWNLPVLKSLCELFDLPSGKGQLLSQGKDDVVADIQVNASERIKEIIEIRQNTSRGITLWGEDLISKTLLEEKIAALDAAKNFFESVQNYKTPGSFKNFKFSVSDISDVSNKYAVVSELKIYIDYISKFGQICGWLTTAKEILPYDNAWIETADSIKSRVINEIRSMKPEELKKYSSELSSELGKLKENYINIYIKLHSGARLGMSEDERKNALINDSRLKTADALSVISLIPKKEIKDFREKLGSLNTCYELLKEDLDKNPVCPHCGFRPSVEAKSEFGNISSGIILESLDEDLDNILERWTAILHTSLKDPVSLEAVKLLNPDEAEAVEDFISTGILPNQIDSEFTGTIDRILSGLKGINISSGEIYSALKKSGGAATPDELKKVF
ncbi:MAG: DUF6079 family protein, partial [Methanomicrobium sp.]|nr:DUF6079 family protein [Methanomicrobium sp.]